MVCIQCYLPPILFMVYMKLLHPFLAPFIEPAIDKVVSLIWGPQAVTQGCPIRSRTGRAAAQSEATPAAGDGEATPSASGGNKSKDD